MEFLWIFIYRKVVKIMMVYVWLVAIIAFVIIEALTSGLVSVWFAGGAVAALISALAGAGIVTQWIVFILASALILIFTKPLIKKVIGKSGEKTNIDANLGKVTIVTETIDNLAQTGEVNLNGLSWTARSADGEVIQKGTKVVVKRVEGVKLIVEII